MASSDLERQCDGAVEHGNDCFIIWICFIYFHVTWKCDGHYSAIIWCHLGFRSPPYAFSTNRFSLPVDFLLIAFSKGGKIMSVLHWPTKKRYLNKFPIYKLELYTIHTKHQFTFARALILIPSMHSYKEYKRALQVNMLQIKGWSCEFTCCFLLWLRAIIKPGTSS